MYANLRAIPCASEHIVGWNFVVVDANNELVRWSARRTAAEAINEAIEMLEEERRVGVVREIA